MNRIVVLGSRAALTALCAWVLMRLLLWVDAALVELLAHIPGIDPGIPWVMSGVLLLVFFLASLLAGWEIAGWLTGRLWKEDTP